jgi:serine/threonine protein phosphatase PrpC
LKAANQKIVEESKNNADIRGMGTTIVFSFLPKKNSNRLYVVNVGDIRAYKIKGENHTVVREAGREEGEEIITQLTEDHSVTAEMVRKGLISEQEARTHVLKHTLTQSLGRPFDHKAFIKRIEWEKDDYLLLCSDGLTDMLEDKEICSTVLQYQSQGRREVANSNKQKDTVKQVITEQTKDDDLIHPLEKTCDALIKKANEKGGRDNITVVLVQNKYHDPNKNNRTKSKDNKKRQGISRM